MVEWRNALQKFDVDVIGRAIEICIRNQERPPNLPQFLSACYSAKKDTGPKQIKQPQRPAPGTLTKLADRIGSPPKQDPVDEIVDELTGEKIPVYMRGGHKCIKKTIRGEEKYIRVPQEWAVCFQPLVLRGGRIVSKQQ